MDIQTIIVAIIICGAALYVGLLIGRKVKSAVAKNSTCAGTDCGCDSNKIKN